MKRYLFKDRRKRNKTILIIAISISVLFLIRVFTLSFSKEIGQAKSNMDKAFISSIYSKIIESGSATLRYQTDREKKEYPFPLNMASGICEIHQHVSASEGIPQNVQIKAQEEINEVQSDVSIDRINYKNITNKILTKEYILTNGAIFNGDDFDDYIEATSLQNNTPQELPIRIMEGAIDYNEFNIGFGGEGGAIETMRSYNGTPFTFEQLNDVGFLIRNFYIPAPSVEITDDLFDAEDFIGKDMTINTSNDKPQILIYHTHSQEAFVDSREGVLEDTVVGVGDLLNKILDEKYGYNVIHDRGIYDLVDGKVDRNKAYNYARDAILKILEENPSIEVVIDIHRDDGSSRSTYINGEDTAQIMLFNGISRNHNGPITRLDNPNVQDNLAFSFQLQLKSLEMYPRFFYQNYLESLRYNLDVRQKSILMELGTDENSLESAKNAMEPFAEILDAVLKGQ
jgi:stage II sporulation protein P